MLSIATTTIQPSNIITITTSLNITPNANITPANDAVTSFLNRLNRYLQDITGTEGVACSICV
jgi:hypothetical protein